MADRDLFDFLSESAVDSAHERATLYQRAVEADAHYAETVCRLTGRDRWTTTDADERIPEIVSALRAKIAADQAWAAYCRKES